LLLTLAALAFNHAVNAQDTGAVAGLVVSTWDGAPLTGVAVTVRGTTLGTQTDAAGRFHLERVPVGEQGLRFSKSGFASALVGEVRVLPGQTTTVNGNLRPEFYDLDEYEITAEEFTQQTEQILIERQSASAMVESLGSDFLSKVGAGNAAESIAKVSGATIVEGKFAVIRGLNDRYVATMLNGASVPSADPYRQSASLDLFPSQVIDRVVVAKTFTPDQPGTYTGGGIDIVTKSFPEKPFLTATLGTAYNSQATFNDRFLTYHGGGLDWAGMDDGSRELPKAVDTLAPIAPAGQSIPAPVPGYMRTNSASYQSSLRLDQITRELGTTEFSPQREAPPPNHNFAATGGGSTAVFRGRFGYLAGVSYKHDYAFYEDGISRRYWNGTELKNSYRESRSLNIANWSGMVNLALEPVENHEVGFLFFYNQNGTDDVREQDQGVESQNDGVFRKANLYWTERNLNTYQLKGGHVFPALAETRFDWMAAMTQTSQDEPDARFFNDRDTGSGYESGANNPNPKDPTRYFRALDESNPNVKFDWTVPIPSWTGEEGKVKVGLFDSYAERTFTDRAFYYPGHGGYGNDPNQFLRDGNLGITSSRTNASGAVRFTWGDYAQVFDSLYNGERDVQAAYAMIELPFVRKFRLVGGARYETTDLNVHSESYLASSVTSLRANDSVLEQQDVLPSLGLIYSARSNMNVRLNYSQTVARPTFRELAAYYSYDPTIGDFIEGNPRLTMTSIDNYDVRWEWFPHPGEVVSVSLFYKDLQDAIERSDLKVDSEVISFKNRPESTLYGLEFEARRTLDFLGDSLRPFSIGGNLALVQSEAKLLPEELSNKRLFFPNVEDRRALYDQSPYIVNFDVSYDNPKIGTTAALILNVSGPRIAITKLNAEDVYEQPAPSLDMVVSKRLGKRTTLRFAARNLLDPEIERTYGEDGNLLYSSYTKGVTLSFSVSYEF
jgi:outer membrane receptor protein involved in Fe transport